MCYSGAGKADICMQKDWIGYQIGYKERNIIIVASERTKVILPASHNIICHCRSYFVKIVCDFPPNMEYEWQISKWSRLVHCFSLLAGNIVVSSCIWKITASLKTIKNCWTTSYQAFRLKSHKVMASRLTLLMTKCVIGAGVIVKFDAGDEHYFLTTVILEQLKFILLLFWKVVPAKLSFISNKLFRACQWNRIRLSYNIRSYNRYCKLEYVVKLYQTHF